MKSKRRTKHDILEENLRLKYAIDNIEATKNSMAMTISRIHTEQDQLLRQLKYKDKIISNLHLEITILKENVHYHRIVFAKYVRTILKKFEKLGNPDLKT